VELIPNNKRFSDREDLANSLSHMAGAILALAGLVIMVVFSSRYGTAVHIVSSIVFGLSMIFLYTSSAVAHWLPEGKKKDAFFTLDQVAIFILIAGTYTPISLLALHGTVGWIVFGIEWCLAIIGIFRLLFRKNVFESGVGVLDIVIYILMGWLIVLVSGPVLKSIPFMGFLWIVVGGLFYSVGVIFYRITRFRYHHLVWHLLVMGGTVSHFVAIFFFVLPRT
jgi:hemolysin III